MPSHDELRARLFLLHAAEPPAAAIHHFVAVHGPVDAVAQIRHGTAPAAVLSEITRPEARIDDDLRALDSGTAHLLTPEGDDWPLGRLTGLARLGVPLALWVRGSGSLAELTSLAVTVTGARASSAYGNTVAADLSYELAHVGVTVVSGGGLGVDEEAHRGALAADGRTIVVLANGVDLAHPHQHARLYQTVIEQGGLLVSEYPIGTPPARIRFHARCRLLAALSAATVITEAGQRSGALTVARAAGELGRRVYGVPGPIHSAPSKGVNELLRTGAATVANSVEHINYQEGLR
ncbi:DNA-processing protein DprA [Amycolatopsis saalfeldensis]|uniref:DNA processing protein n=1 Tax=Amycolatopsis saalfeldensis TaxID=394193 RepID=A0A1H8YGK9_9PSEU|nr:DNA-processing protein DprA [Amycolatopsis saalfeldensis]SEP50578.1 DNA processing protein [Amycolatopsis saalfeldensis]